MANLNELLIGLGYAVQATISTAPTTPGYWRLPNLNKKPWSQKVVNDDDRTEIGKGHEFPTQQWKSHYDNGTYTVERPAAAYSRDRAGAVPLAWWRVATLQNMSNVGDGSAILARSDSVNKTRQELQLEGVAPRW